MSEYVLDNARAEAAHRMTLLEHLFDPHSFSLLETLVRPGARCWEVGAGGGSCARYMDLFAASGVSRAQVWATDVDTRYTDAPRCTVLEHNVVTDDAPATDLDVVHMRLVASHLGMHTFADVVLPKLVAALRPGGVLVVEELDPMGPYAPSLRAPNQDRQRAINAVGEAFTQVLASKGGHPWLGRDLRALLGLHLNDTQANGYLATHRGGGPAAALMRANIEQVRDHLPATAKDVDTFLAAMLDPDIHWQMPTYWQAVGVAR